MGRYRAARMPMPDPMPALPNIHVGDRVKVLRHPYREESRDFYGRAAYIHPSRRWVTVQGEHYRESFWTEELEVIN